MMLPSFFPSSLHIQPASLFKCVQPPCTTFLNKILFNMKFVNTIQSLALSCMLGSRVGAAEMVSFQSASHLRVFLFSIFNIRETAMHSFFIYEYIIILILMASIPGLLFEHF